MKKEALAIALAGLLGGFVASKAPFVVRALAQSSEARSISNFALRDSSGAAKIYLVKLGGDGSTIAFYNQRMIARLTAGIYPENPALPVLALAPDAPGNAVKGLLRLAGVNHSGVVVLKDKPDRDRIVMGLNLANPNEEPFLAYADDKGMHNLFGSF